MIYFVTFLFVHTKEHAKWEILLAFYYENYSFAESAQGSLY